MPSYLKITTVLLFSLAAFLVCGFASAADTPTSVIQPAGATKIGDLGHYIDEYSSYASTNTAWHFDETAHFPDVHIGAQGLGGVTFFNGTIINDTTVPAGSDVAEAGEPLPVTFGDDVRIDGSIWRGTSKGTSDNMPLRIADSMEPELTNVNNIGSTSKRWNDAWFYGTAWVGKLGGDNVVTEENLYATNTAVANYVLSYSADGQFTWTNSALSSLSCSTGQVAKWDGTAWACAADIDTNTGGSTPTPPTGTNTKIIYGRTLVPAFDSYGDGGVAVNIPASTGFTDTDNYTVTAAYDIDSTPLGVSTTIPPLSDLCSSDGNYAGPCVSIGVIKNSTTRFTLYTNHPSDGDGETGNLYVDWRAIGH